MGKNKRIKREYNNLMDMLDEVAISINVFVKRMLGVYDDNIMRAEITHKDLVKMFPKLKRTSFDEIMDDPSCIYNGDVIAVRDSKLNIVPYINMQKRHQDIDNTENNYLDTEDFNEELLFGQLVKDETTGEWKRTTVQDNSTWTKGRKTEKSAVKYDLKDMTVYELTVLMELYSKTGQWHDHEVVRRELVKREDSGRANTKSKQKALKKSMRRFNDDEY